MTKLLLTSDEGGPLDEVVGELDVDGLFDGGHDVWWLRQL